MGKLNDRLMGKTAGLAEKVAQNPGKSIADQPPVTMPGQLGAFRIEAKKYLDRIEELDRLLQQAKNSSSTFEIKCSDIYQVPGRRRRLSEEEYGELKQNLKNNPLAHAITVRKRESGLTPVYELISGYNRHAIFCELGRETIRAEVIDCDQNQAELAALFANLFQSNLSDFETYLAFKKILENEPDLTQEDIADRVGKSRSSIAMIMSFSYLPGDSLELIKKQPHLLGGNTARDLAALVKKGRTKQVKEAISKVISGEIKQGEAVKIASSNPKTPLVSKREIDQRIVKIGKTTYCNIRLSEKIVRLEFKSDEEASEMSAAIEEILKTRVKELKTSAI